MTPSLQPQETTFLQPHGRLVIIEEGSRQKALRLRRLLGRDAFTRRRCVCSAVSRVAQRGGPSPAGKEP